MAAVTAQPIAPISTREQIEALMTDASRLMSEEPEMESSLHHEQSVILEKSLERLKLTAKSKRKFTRSDSALRNTFGFRWTRRNSPDGNCAAKVISESNRTSADGCEATGWDCIWA